MYKSFAYNKHLISLITMQDQKTVSIYNLGTIRSELEYTLQDINLKRFSALSHFNVKKATTAFHFIASRE